MWRAFAWICQLIATPCPPPLDVDAIQTAYEREGAAGSKLHDEGLKVLQAKCHDRDADRHLCEVTFMSRKDPAQRLYFDIVAVDRQGNDWELKSGLCKR